MKIGKYYENLQQRKHVCLMCLFSTLQCLFYSDNYLDFILNSFSQRERLRAGLCSFSFHFKQQPFHNNLKNTFPLCSNFFLAFLCSLREVYSELITSFKVYFHLRGIKNCFFMYCIHSIPWPEMNLTTCL